MVVPEVQFVVLLRLCRESSNQDCFVDFGLVIIIEQCDILSF